MSHYITPSQYDGFMRATETAIYMSNDGSTAAISVEELPSVLNFITKGLFKMSWAPYHMQRKHIAFEQLDDKLNFRRMKAMMESDDDLADFLRYHMQMTKSLFKWNYA